MKLRQAMYKEPVESQTHEPLQEVQGLTVQPKTFQDKLLTSARQGYFYLGVFYGNILVPLTLRLRRTTVQACLHLGVFYETIVVPLTLRLLRATIKTIRWLLNERNRRRYIRFLALLIKVIERGIQASLRILSEIIGAVFRGF